MDIPTSDNKSLKERLVHSKYRNTWVFILCCFVITVPTHNSPYAPENKHTNTNPYTPGKRRPPPPLTERYTLGALNGYPETNEQSTRAHYTSNYLNPQGFSSRQPVIYSTPKDVFTGIPLKNIHSNQSTTRHKTHQEEPTQMPPPRVQWGRCHVALLKEIL